MRFLWAKLGVANSSGNKKNIENSHNIKNNCNNIQWTMLQLGAGLPSNQINTD